MEMKDTGIISGNGDEQATLVVVFLRGGADGLTLVPPVAVSYTHLTLPTILLV